MIHVRPVVAMVVGAFLLAVGRVIGGIEVQKDALGRTAVLHSLSDVELHECLSYPVARAGREGILKARDRRLACEVGPRLRQSATNQLEQGIGA